MTFKRIFISIWVFIIAGCFSVDVFAKPPGEIRDLLAKESVLNEKCRGGSGDNPDTMKACEARDNLFLKLKSKGWCYGKKGQFGYQMEWHQCTSQSIK